MTTPTRDGSITVRERIETPSYSSWSEKAGVVTVRPPATVLERMLALRIHLDDRDADSGALRVIPGSHRLPAEATRPETPEPELCVASSGDALLMRRLLWHTSAQTTTPTRRRVIHFEFADAELTPPLAWFEQVRP